jgi:hypothetical protein
MARYAPVLTAKVKKLLDDVPPPESGVPAKPAKPVFDTVLNPEVQRKIVNFLAEGLPLSTVCALVGRDVKVVDKWLQNGSRDSRGIYYDFALACQKAIALGVKDRVDRINEHARLDWRADTWMLMHGPDKHNWTPAPTQGKVQVSGNVTHSLEQVASEMPLEILEGEVERLAIVGDVLENDGVLET